MVVVLNALSLEFAEALEMRDIKTQYSEYRNTVYIGSTLRFLL